MELAQLILLGSVIYLFVSFFQKLIKTQKSPLVKVPGPYLCKLTSGCSLYYILTGQVHTWMHSLHLKYGPIVQFSPYEISIISQDDVEAIYNSYQFKKTPFYKALEFGGRNISSIIERESHAARKKILAKFFNKRNIENLESLFNRVVIDPLVEKLDEYAKTSEEFDIYKLSIHCFFNFIGMFTLSEKLNLVSTGSHPITKWLEDSQKYSILSFQFPWSKLVGNMIGKEGFLALQKFCHEKIIQRQTELNSEKNDILNIFLEYNKNNPELSLSNAEITGEITIQFLAGIEAPGTTLAWLIKLLIKHPKILSKLQLELEKAFPSCSDKITISRIHTHCPYLDAVLCEAFRIYPVVGGYIPRVVPKSGYIFSGFYIPENTVVGFSGYAYHRSPLVWKQPDDFIPDRFLNDPQHICKSLLMSFIKGPNSCLGREIGLMSLHLSIATIFRRYNLSMDPKKLNFKNTQYLALKSFDNKVLVSISKKT